MIEEVFAVSKIAKKRTMANVFMKLSEEVGELATEINIADGCGGSSFGELCNAASPTGEGDIINHDG